MCGPAVLRVYGGAVLGGCTAGRLALARCEVRAVSDGDAGALLISGIRAFPPADESGPGGDDDEGGGSGAISIDFRNALTIVQGANRVRQDDHHRVPQDRSRRRRRRRRQLWCLLARVGGRKGLHRRFRIACCSCLVPVGAASHNFSQLVITLGAPPPRRSDSAAPAAAAARLPLPGPRLTAARLPLAQAAPVALARAGAREWRAGKTRGCFSQLRPATRSWSPPSRRGV